MLRIRVPKKLTVAPALMAALLAVGCGAQEGASEENGEDAVDSVAGELNKPPDYGLAPSHDIDICWRSADFTAANLVTFRRNVRYWIDEHIGRVSDLRFNGWGQCPAITSSGRFLQLQTDSTIGNSLGGYTQTNVASPWGYQTGWPTQVRYGQDGLGANVGGQMQGSRGVILHELMHALGFGHEINRTATRTDMGCVWEYNGLGNTYNTPYDHNSIMNFTYCNPGTPDVLSAWDVVGLQRAYGPKPYQAMTGASNKCVDIENPSLSPPTSATRLQAYRCLNNGNQQWVALPVTNQTGWSIASFPFVVLGNYNAYMDVQWGNSANGTPLFNWTFNGSEAQRWTLSGGEIRGMGDLCLDVPGSNFATNQTLQLWGCNGTNAQKWDIFHNPAANNGTYIRSTAAPNLCLTKTGPNTVTLQTCDYLTNPQPASQRFMTVLGHISTDSSSSCLDVQWANPAWGTLVQLVGCRATNGSDQLNDAQRWYYRGPVKGIASKCLDFDAPTYNTAVPESLQIAEGTKAQIWDCHGFANQTFDFHF